LLRTLVYVCQGSDAAQPLWYVMDEFGSRIQHSDNPNVRLIPFCYVPTQSAFTVMWPLADIDDGGRKTLLLLLVSVNC